VIRRSVLCSALLGLMLSMVLAGESQAGATCLPTVSSVIQDIVDQGQAPGVAVRIEQRGKVIFDRRAGHLTGQRAAALPEDAIWRIYSMTKPITSVAVMMLVEQGKLSLDDPFSTYEPAFAHMKVRTDAGEVPAERPITVRDLLRHTSGLVYEFFGTGPVRDAYKAAGLRQAGMTNQKLAGLLAGLPLESQPGTLWEYSFSTDMLGHLIERVSGEPLDQFLRSRILDPLEMRDTRFLVPEGDGGRIAEAFVPLPDYRQPRSILSGGGGLASTVPDYLSFLRMLRNGGTLNGHRILKPETVAEMTRDQTVSAGIRPGRYYAPGAGHGFGLGFAVRIAPTASGAKGPVGTYYWGGVAGTSFWVDPVNDIIAVAMVQTIRNRRAIRGAVRDAFYKDFGLDGRGEGASGC